MTKQDFIALADAIRGMVKGETTQTIQGMVDAEDMTRVLADFCQSQNPRFNRERWLNYIAGHCGKNGGKVK